MTAPSSNLPTYRFGDFEANLATGEVRRHGVRLRLQDQPFRVLALLLERTGGIVTREELRKELWPADTFVDFDTGLNSAIKRLRDVLGDSASEPRYVETIPRRGYRLLVAVEKIAPAENAIPAPTVAAHSNKPLTRTLLLGLGVSAILLAAILLPDWGAVRSRLPGVASRPQVHSLAVLPFKNVSALPEQEYFVDGFTDSLITELARIRNVDVVSRTSVMRYKGDSATEAAQIGQELGVDAVVEGTLLRSEDRLRVNVRLIHTATNRDLWSRSYARDSSEVLKLQAQLAQDITRQVRGYVALHEQNRLAVIPAVDPEAHEAYVMGRHFLSQQTPQALQHALESFQKVVQREPNFAPAYTGLAESYSLMGFSMAATRPSAETAESARRAAWKALELDPTEAGSRVILAWILYQFDSDPPAAELEFKKAIALNPNLATAYHLYSRVLMNVGRDEEFCAAIERARKLDPLSADILRDVAFCLFLVKKQPERAIATAQQAIALGPATYNPHITLGMILFEMRKYDEALAAFLKADEISHGHPATQSLVGVAYSKLGQRNEAQRILAALKRRNESRTCAMEIAIVYDALGRPTEAMNWLEKSEKEHTLARQALTRHSLFKSLFSEPRFQALLQRQGLSQRTP